MQLLTLPSKFRLFLVLPLTAVIQMSGCQPPTDLSTKASDTALDAETAELHSVTIRTPPIPRGVKTSLTDSSGEPVLLSCRSCHSNLEAKRSTASSAQLEKFHQGLHVDHGKLKCVSCHNPDDSYESLRLADGTAISYSESIRLCAQCHGTQYDDYQHGSHGGMTGYWDLTRGGRVRNHCLHCHEPHDPHYPVFQPAPPPKDRFSPISEEESHE